MRKKILALGLALLITSLAACSGPQTSLEPVQATVKRGDIVQTVNARGALSLVGDQKLSFQGTGQIKEVKVKEGDKVSKGDVLARLDTTDLDQAMVSAELAVKAAQADYQSAQLAQATVKDQELAVQSAQLDLQTAQLAQTSMNAAQISLDTAMNSLTKISYPYNYATFTLNVPDAIAAVHQAQLDLNLAKGGLSAAVGTTAYTQAWDHFQSALDNLTKAQQSLQLGQDADAFLNNVNTVRTGIGPSTGQYSVTDYWTLRSAQLAVSGAQTNLDQATNGYKMGLAKANLGVARTQQVLDETKNNVKVVLDKATVNLDSARNNLAKTKTALDKASVIAPFDGIVAMVNAKVGDVLSAVDYNKTIVEVVDPKTLELDVYIDEADLPGVKAGQDVKVGLDALPGATLNGKITFVAPIPRSSTGSPQYLAKISMTVPGDFSPASGMNATAEIVTGMKSNVLTVPASALNLGDSTVRVMANGQAQTKKVVYGVSDGSSVEIVSGLNENDTVLIPSEMKLSLK